MQKHLPLLKNTLFFGLFVFLSLGNLPQLSAQITVNNGYTPTQLVQDVLVGGGCVAIQNITYTGAAGARGYFANGTAAIGLASGVILSSGSAVNAALVGCSSFATADMGTPGDATLNTLTPSNPSLDAAVLEFDFRPTIPNVTFRYAFASEEYPEWVGTSFNDIFGFFISGPGIAGVQNIALIPGTSTAVEINSVNQTTNTAYYNSCAGNFVFDGFTDVLTAAATVQTCQWYHIKLAIADRGDRAYDSAVFLESNSFLAGATAVASATYSQSGATGAFEGCVNGTFTFTRSDITDTSTPLTFTYTVGGTATAGADYTASPALTGTITIPAGQTSVSISITALADGIPEGVETITLQLPGNNCNCTGPPAPVTMNIFNYTPVAVTIPPVAPACGGQAISITANVTGGIAFPAYNYTWSTGATTNPVIVTPAGTTTYTVTVTDLCGTSATANTTVTLNPSLNVGLVPLNPACGQNNGEIAVSVTGGTAPYTYAWNPSSIGNNGNPTGLAPGSYSVTVTGAGGCTGSANTTLATSGSITALLNATPTSCGNTPDGSLSLNTNASGSPTITWSGPNSIPSGTVNPTGLAVGTYTVTVSAGGGCSATATATITAGPTPTASLTPSPTSCDGAADGSLLLTTTAIGTPSITWSGPTAIPLGTTNPTNLAAGTYTVTVSSGATCNATATATIAPGPSVSASLIPTTTSCNGAADGQLSLTFSGATFGTAQWSGPTAIPPGTQNPTGLLPGAYSVTVTSANGCTAIASATIPIGPDITASLTTVPAVCNTSPDGSAVLTTNAIPPYTTAWTSTPAWAAPAPNTTIGTGLFPGTYNITITQANGCSASATAVVAPGPPISVSLTPTPPTCGFPNGTISVQASGGNAPYNFNWNPPSLNSAPNPGNPTGLNTGTYTVTVTSDNGCSASASTTLTPTPPITASIQATNGTCSGGGNGALDLTAGGGTSPYVFAWSGGLPAQEDHASVPAGSYTVTVADANGCTAVASATITVPTPLSASILPTPALCSGAASGTLDLSVSGGASPYTFAWSGGLPAVEDPTSAAAGSYTVTITDSQGCTATATASVTEPPAITASVTPTPTLCVSDNTGSLSVTAGGGTPGYTYTWSNPALSGANPMGVAAGSYTVTVTDSQNCTAVASATVDSPTPVDANLIPTPALCSGAANGQILLTASGGTPTYTYVWSDASLSGANPLNVPAGNYSVTVTDANSCTAVGTVNVSEPAPVSAAITPMPASCAGQNDGMLNVTASGGIPGYTYDWSDPALSGANPSGVAPGSYSVTITDTNGCTAVASATITAPTALSVALAATPAPCSGLPGGALSATASGGTPNYTFTWSDATLSGASPNQVSAGTYTVTATDASGCTAQANATVTEPTELNLTVTPTNITCNGAANGQLLAEATGGTPGYTYTWSGGLPPIANPTGVNGGSYTVTVTDANGCTAVTPSVVGQPNPLNIVLTPTPVSCNGSNNGSIATTVTGGTPSYSFNWNNGLPPVEDPSGLVPGNYAVTVTDGNGCSAQANISISEPTALAGSASSTAANCGQNDGTATVSASGGTAPYTYTWSPPAVSSTASAANLAAGSYTVTVTDASGCTVEIPVAVSNLDGPQLTIDNAVNAVCSAANGSISVTASGGTPPLTITWSHDAAFSGTTANNLPAGNYTITVLDGNGCQANQSVVLTDAPPPTVLVSDQNNPTCEQANGNITVTVSNGMAPFTYAWSIAGATNAPTLNNVAAGTYSVTVTDANNCTGTATATLAPSLNPAMSGNFTNATCGLLNGNISLSVANGTPPFNYAWNPASIGNTTTAAGLDAGTYSVTVTDANGCTDTDSFVVQNTTPPQIVVDNVQDATCGQDNGSINISATGTGTLTYTWSGGLGSTATPLFVPSGIYTVTVSDTDGCSSTESVTVGDTPLPVLSIVSQLQATCNMNNGAVSVIANGGTGALDYQWGAPLNASGENQSNLSGGTYSVTVTDAAGCTDELSINLSASDAPNVSGFVSDATCGNDNGNISLQVTGGVSPLAYNWSPNVATGDLASNLSAGNYSVTVTDGNGCSSFAGFVIADSPAPQILLNSLANTDCGNSNGAISITAFGGTLPYGYDWAGTPQNTANINNLAAGTYAVTVTDGNNCENTATYTITDTPAPVLSPGAVVPSTCGNSNGSATVLTAGGLAPLTYTWSAPGGSTPTISNVTAGNYTITVTAANGCTDTETMTVTNIAGVSLSAPVVVNETCGNANGTLTVTASGGVTPYTYTWSNNALLNNPANTGLAAGLYSVTVTDNNNCTATASAAVTNAPSPELSLVNSTQATCGNADGTATVSATGGTAPYTYVWDGSASTTTTATGLAAAGYSVTVTDANGCQDVLPIAITNAGGPSITLDNTIPDACDQAIGSVSVTASGGTAPLTYTWSHDAALNSNTATDLLAGNYFVTVSDANNCQAVATATVANQAAPTIAVSALTPSNCGYDDATATVSVSGGTGTISYAWTPNVSTTNSASNIAAGDYSVTATDENNCTASIDFTITNNPAPALVPNGTTPAACGQSNGSASVLASNGTMPYTYTWSHDATINAATAPNLGVGTYSVTVTDANGCQATTTVSVASLNAPAITVDNVIDETCGNGNGEITISANGGTAPYAYTWSHDATLNAATATNLSQGDYSITVTDDLGCQDVETIAISNAPSVFINVDNITDGTCGNTNGSVDISLSGGTAPYSFAWSNAATTEDLSNVDEACYTVTVTDGSGCMATAEACVGNTIPPDLQLDNTNEATCGNDNGAATVAVAANTGTAPFTYTWTGGVSNGASATDLAGGDYTITVSDAAGCNDILTLTISATASPDLAPDTTNPAACGQADGTASVVATGGTAPYTYTWQNNGSTTETATGLAAGSYNITVTDQNGCTDMTTITVSNEGGPQITATDNTQATCELPNGAASVTVTGGTGTITYTWTGGVSNTNTATNLAAGDYTVTVADANNCQAVATITVPGTTNPTLLLDSSTDATCGNANGTATVVASGGTAPYTTYTWSPGGVTTSGAASDMAAGNYAVTVTDDMGCTASVTFAVGDSPSVLLTEGIIDPAACGQADGAASVVTSGGTAPYTYTWSPNVSSSDNASNIAAGAYSVTVTDAAGCSDVVALNVGNENGPTAEMTATASVCDLEQGTATITTTGGTAPYTYEWQPNVSSTATATGLNPGDYAATVTDANGCVVTVVATVVGSIPPPIIACGTITDNSVEFVWEAVPGAVSYEITVNGTTTTVAATELSYVVSGLGVNESVTISIVTIGDAICGESSAATWTCTSTGCPDMVLSISGLGDVYCADDNSVTLSGTPTGGTFSGIGMTGNVFDPAIAGVGTHTITYNYTAPDGCPYTTTATTTVIALPQPTFTSPEWLCTGNSGSFVFSGVPVAGTSYLWNFGSAGAQIGVGPHSVAWNSIGQQTVMLTMTSPEGCVATAMDTIPVSDMDVAASSATAVIDLGTSTILTATALSGLDGEVTYAWTPDNSLSCNNCPEPTATPGAMTTYTVVATDQYGCEASATVSVDVVYTKAVIIPNAFSPNSDNLNGLFRPQGLNIQDVYLEIRNRWGNKIYAETLTDLNTQGWDGKFDGKDVDMAVYVYYATVTFTDGSQEFLKGNVTLVR
ncbi:MAG: choice-of-anchor L domain-containing protein [Chitinophagales bacterium]|nr:choice-of-anchor L domain-containing protein [Chitinophagales bacterium]